MKGNNKIKISSNNDEPLFLANKEIKKIYHDEKINKEIMENKKIEEVNEIKEADTINKINNDSNEMSDSESNESDEDLENSYSNFIITTSTKKKKNIFLKELKT